MAEIQIEIEDEVLDRLTLIARANGLTVEEYALKILRNEFRKPAENAARSADETPS